MHISRAIILTLFALSSLSIETRVTDVFKRIHWSYNMTQLTSQQKKNGWALFSLNQFLYYNENKLIDYTTCNPSLCLDILLLRNTKKQKTLEQALHTLIEAYNHASHNEEKQYAKTSLKNFIQHYQIIPDNQSLLALQKNACSSMYKAMLFIVAGATALPTASLATCFLIKRYKNSNNTVTPDSQEPIIIPNTQPISKNTLRITNTIAPEDTRKWIESRVYTGWKTPKQFTVTVNGKKLRKNESIDIAKTDPIKVVYKYAWQEKFITIASGEYTIQYAQPNTQDTHFALTFDTWLDYKECIAIQPPLPIKSSVNTKLYLNPLLKKLGFIK